MKSILLSFWLILLSPFSYSNEVALDLDANSLTYFENPFLIGDWYFFKPAQVENDYDVLHISLSSTRKFVIEMIEMSTNMAEEWSGTFELSQENIRFGKEGEESQVYQYEVNHNRLYLNGVEFFKVVPESIIGSWHSKLVSGEDIMVSNVESLNLKLRSDFVFLLEVVSHSGKRNQ